jgi:hypothetical protein
LPVGSETITNKYTKTIQKEKTTANNTEYVQGKTGKKNGNFAA